jgi:hypothetical protein
MRERDIKIQGTTIEYDDFQIAVLLNLVESETKNLGVSAVKCHLIYAFYFLSGLRGMQYIPVIVMGN